MTDTAALFRDDAYARSCRTTVTRIAEDGALVVAQSVFYPTGGGQPGDSGRLIWDGGDIAITTTRKEDATGVALVPEAGAETPPAGTAVEMVLDWEPRYQRMRIHTALHLLSVVIPLPVTGGSIGPGKGRLDFDMAEPPEDKQALEDQLNALIARDLVVSDNWITDAELEANPGLVKTMSVRPPMGQGRVRLVRIGTADEQIDLQPCGGTHVRTTAEIGRIALGKVEKKGKQNRRVTLTLA
ncbi:alanyl-tRNA editing protein [Pararhodobacter zhoushanensis]|uniref:alanyl-tRNA editing protein n=1 Tax=Pararhodobacter zhoushanensis TaxID=2479545 RepID=UPI000F8EB4E0|nr:alanyl-tRNA editing protein [Pararhodobacter zhoushanensis]